MEEPHSPSETPRRRKRNPSFRRILRKQDIEVPSVIQRQRDPALPPKRKRAYRHPGRHKAKKRKRTEAAATNETSELAELANPPPAATTGSRPASPAAVPSPTSSPAASLAAESSAGGESSPKVTTSPTHTLSPSARSQVEPEPANHTNETTSNDIVWDPVDPLGLFDELEGPLSWPSEGLWD